jgi:exosortase K
VRSRIDKSYWQSLLWWLPVFTLAFLLKQHYSNADAAELGWILQPLSDLLSLLTGSEFHRQANGEWLSITADVRLVKSCAGINFMLMSLLAFAWTFRPDRKEQLLSFSWVGGHLALLGAICIAAWATTLLANTLRILLAMSLPTDGSIIQALGIDGEEMHRLIGLAVYLPLLTLQMLPGRRLSRWQIISIPVVLYTALMVVVPLLTGNALRNPALFIEHVTQLAVAIAIIQPVLLLLLRRQRLQCHRQPSRI